MNFKTSGYYSIAFVLVMAGVLCIRIVSLWFNNSELFFDEAQYWFWAQDLEFGYFSKPPLLAWIIAGTTSICGSDSEFCARLAAPALHIATAGFVFLSAKHLFDSRTGFWAGVFYATMPAVSLSSTIISTDVPLLFCWSIALYAYVRLRETYGLGWVILLGLAIGLGLNAKYAMAYFVGCALIHMLVEQQQYTPPRRYGFWGAVLIALAMLAPNILWNIDHDFVTASHTGDNIGWTGFSLNWSGLAEFVGAQFGVFGPILFGIFIAAAIRMFKDSISTNHRLLLSFSLPILLVIIFQAVISKAYANWAATTYVAATILVAEVMINRIPWGWLKTSMSIHGVVFIAIAIAVCFAGPGQLVLPNGAQPFTRTQGASLIAIETEKLLNEYDYSRLVTTDRKLSALMQYNLRHREEPIQAWSAGEFPTDHFQLKVPYQASSDDRVLVVSRSNNIDVYNSDFTTAVSLGSREISAGEVEKVYFFRLEGYGNSQ